MSYILMEYYICTDEHGYQGPYSSYSEAVRNRNFQGYGDVILRTNEGEFKLKRYE